MTSTLRKWLSGLTETELAGILQRRPDVLVPRPPSTLADLADRLHRQQSLRSVLFDMPQPCLDLLETLLVFGAGGMTRAHLAAILDVLEDDDTLAATLSTCELWAIAWEVDGRIWIPGAIRSLCPSPLRLGPPVAEFLNQRTVDDLALRARILGLVPESAKKMPRKSDLLDVLSRFYADGDAVRAIAALAPADQRELVEFGAEHNPVLADQPAYYYSGQIDPAIAWLLQHGLVIHDWQSTSIPREVGIALRGTGWHPTLTPHPPAIPTVEIKGGADAVTQDAASAASAAIEQFGAVIDACGGTPVALLKTGGVGVREIRRLAKSAGTTEATTRLWLEIAFAADLVDVDGDELVPTPEFDEWLALPPAKRLTAMIDVWLDMQAVPLMERRPEGVPVRPVLTHDDYASLASEVRLDVLQASAAIPPGESPAPTKTGSPIAAWVQWSRPVICSYLSGPAYATEGITAEAIALGIIGRGALSPLGKAITGDGDRRAALDAAAAKLVRDATAEAIFQADLTIVVPGSPTAAVARLLDSVADRESRGAAGTWRCSAESVRRAFDAGQTTDGILTALRAIAVGGVLPQPLEYLIADVSRRHGTLRARSVGCILRADDPALLAEIAATKALASLRLALLAPTVLASTLPLDRTLAALRSAGYAPVGEADDGAAMIERPKQRRTPQRARVLPFHQHGDDATAYVTVRQRGGQESSPSDVAAALVASAEPDEPEPGALLELVKPAAPRTAIATPPERLVNAPVKIPTLRTVQQSARQLGAEEQHVLAQAIDNQRPIRIVYEDGQENITKRVIEPIELEGSLLTAWCRLRNDERAFHLSNIKSVRAITD